MDETDDIPPEISNPAYGIIIKKGKGEQIPIGSRPIGLYKLVKIQQARIYNWVPKEDVWAIRHSVKISAVFSSLTSVVSLMYVRRFFQLHSQKIPTTFIPSVVVPMAVSGIFNELFIRNKLLEGTNNCSLCMELRGSLAQVCCGSMFPLLMSYAICIPVAKMERSYPIPKLNEYRKFYDMWRLSMSKGRNAFILMGLMNSVIGAFLVNRMLRCVAVMEERDNYVYKQLQANGGAEYKSSNS